MYRLKAACLTQGEADQRKAGRLAENTVASTAGHLWAFSRPVALATVLAALGVGLSVARAASALPPSSRENVRASTQEGTSSDAARREAVRLIPFDKLAAEDRAKVSGVVSNAAVFRRMPVRVIDCDPDMYLFLVRHPDVVVNIWEVFKVSRLQLQQVDDERYRVAEPAGATATVEYLYRSHDLHVIYGEGVYEGPMLPRPIKGRGVLILKTGYVRETNGRYYVTSRLDCLLSVEPLGAELLTKTLSPLVGKTVDNNFVQTLAFVGSLSRTAETNGRGVQRLSEQLTRVRPGVRTQFAELATSMSNRASLAAAAGKKSPVEKLPVEMASRPH